jgi:hypothetical protein
MNDHTIVDNADDDMEFAIKMTVMQRTAARAADELAMSYRELAHRFAEQVDADLASDVDPLKGFDHPGVPGGLSARTGDPGNAVQTAYRVGPHCGSSDPQ